MEPKVAELHQQKYQPLVAYKDSKEPSEPPVTPNPRRVKELLPEPS